MSFKSYRAKSWVLTFLSFFSYDYNKNNREIKKQKLKQFLRENCVEAVITVIFSLRKRRFWLRFLNANKVVCDHLLMRLRNK